MSSFGPSATMTKTADIYATAGLVAKGGGVREPFGFADSLYAHPGVASAVRDTLAEQQRMQDRMMKSLGPSATVAGSADVYATAGLAAKAGWMPDTSGVTKSWQSQAGIGSAVQDKVHELERMHDRVVRDFGSPASVAGAADIYAISGPLAAKESLARGGFGLATSLDEAIAAQKRMEHPWADYGAAAMATGAGMHKAPGMAATIASYGSAAGGVDQLGGFASGLVGAGLLAKLDETIAGMHKGSMDLSSLMTATGGIADPASFLTDVRGLARITDEISRLERSSAIPSAVTGMARTLAGSAQMARTVRGVDPFTGLAIPMGIGAYPSMSGVVAGQATPAGGPTEPTLIVPSAAESALLLDWLRDHASTHEQALRVCDALSGLYVFLALVEAEAHINPSPVVLQTQAWSALVLFVFQLLLRRAKPRE